MGVAERDWAGTDYEASPPKRKKRKRRETVVQVTINNVPAPAYVYEAPAPRSSGHAAAGIFMLIFISPFLAFVLAIMTGNGIAFLGFAWKVVVLAFAHPVLLSLGFLSAIIVLPVAASLLAPKD